MTSATTPRPRVWFALLARLCELCSFGLPLALAVGRVGATPQWEGDFALVRDVGLLPLGFGGVVETYLTQVALLVPLGSLAFRASLVSAVALGVASWAAFRLGVVLVRRRQGLAPSERLPKGPLDLVVCLLAALAVGLSPPLQLEATAPGGALVGGALALLVLLAALGELGGDPELSGPQVGALAAMLTVELPVASLAMGAAGLALVATSPRAKDSTSLSLGARVAAALRTRDPWTSSAGAGALTFVVVSCALAGSLALRPLWATGVHELGALVRTSASFRTLPEPRWALGRFHESAGAGAAVTAFVGVLAVAWDGVRRLRRRSASPALQSVLAVGAPLLVVQAVHALTPSRMVAPLAAGTGLPLEALALLALGPLTALGTKVLLDGVEYLRIPLAGAVRVLGIAIELTLLALIVEEGGEVGDRSRLVGADAFTEEALGRLPPRTALYVTSPDVAWRLWAAQLTAGDRPDVLVVPAPLLDRPHVVEALSAAEPAVVPLLRDVALAGAPSEYSLSVLADARALRVEPDASWPAPVRRHLRPAGLWIEYSAEPLGSSDRKLAADVAPSLKRVLPSLDAPHLFDVRTGDVLARSLERQTHLLTALGETESRELLAAGVWGLEPPNRARVGGPLERVARGVPRPKAAPAQPKPATPPPRPQPPAKRTGEEPANKPRADLSASAKQPAKGQAKDTTRPASHVKPAGAKASSAMKRAVVVAPAKPKAPKAPKRP